LKEKESKRTCFAALLLQKAFCKKSRRSLSGRLYARLTK
jgi:hypothetical protein